jgi:zinc metalloprotease ZmpA
MNRLPFAALVSTLLLAPAAGGALPRDAGPSASAGAEARAHAHVARNAQAVAADGTERFTARDLVVDPDGTEHVRFDREWQGLRVVGGDTVVHSRAGRFLGAHHTLAAAVRVGTIATVPAAEAVRLASAVFPYQADGNSSAELVILARGPVRLAHEVVVFGARRDGTPSEYHVFVDARSGQVLEKWDAVQDAAGSGVGFFVGTVPLETTLVSGSYQLKDPTRGNQYTIDMGNTTRKGTIFSDADNLWGNGTLANRQTVGVDAQFGTAMTWDYYKNVHGRNGIANDGKGAYNRVHYSRNYNNAFWQDSCFCMTYGDGDGVNFNPFDSLDVAGHEMTHGLTSRTAALVYSGEPGGLNEATSDIFGTMVEYYANNALDTPDYLIGEKLYKNNPTGTKALRYMYKPSLDGLSPDCWSSTLGTLDVHYSSGVGNHFFYLLAEGSKPATGPASPTCNASSVTGIGRAKAEKIWFRALTVYMTSSTKYAGARTATLSAATDLYGATSAERAAVAAAWSAVSVN